MAISIPRIYEKNGATPAELIQESIREGKEIGKIYSVRKFNPERGKRDAIASAIRACNMYMGAGGNFKDGCLYREKGLPESWRSHNGDGSGVLRVVCDHAVPVRELVRRHLDENQSIESLIFSPVVRISEDTNSRLTKGGYAKKGHKTGFPLHRYSHLEGIQLVTHFGDEVNPATWSDGEHWRLVFSTEELKTILRLVLPSEELKKIQTELGITEQNSG